MRLSEDEPERGARRSRLAAAAAAAAASEARHRDAFELPGRVARALVGVKGQGAELGPAVRGSGGLFPSLLLLLLGAKSSGSKRERRRRQGVAVLCSCSSSSCPPPTQPPHVELYSRRDLGLVAQQLQGVQDRGRVELEQELLRVRAVPVCCEFFSFAPGQLSAASSSVLLLRSILFSVSLSFSLFVSLFHIMTYLALCQPQLRGPRLTRSDAGWCGSCLSAKERRNEVSFSMHQRRFFSPPSSGSRPIDHQLRPSLDYCSPISSRLPLPSSQTR